MEKFKLLINQLFNENKKNIHYQSLKSLILILIISSPVFAIPSTTRSLIRNSPKEVLDEVWQIVYRDYLDASGDYDSDDWIDLRKKLLSKKYIHYDNVYVAIREMLSNLKDPYTRFLDPKEFNEMKIDTSGELTGVGIQISLDSDTNKIVVVSPIEGTPAFKAGIIPKDVIVSIDGKSTDGMSIDRAVKLIRGQQGTPVILGVMRRGKLLKISLVRTLIEIHSVTNRLNLAGNKFKVGYIRLKQFNANAAREMSDSIKELEDKNAMGYILDLRGNPGGLLEASVEIARQWIDQGIIVSTKTRDGITDVRMANQTALTQKPLVVLVNEGSASASEILSGAIRDNERGILVGNKTFGKGLVQSVRALSDGSGLTVTIAKYLTPKGTDINKNGIHPDIKIDIDKKLIKKLTILDLGTIKDNQYIVAETALVRKIAKQSQQSTYVPSGVNLEYALK